MASTAKSRRRIEEEEEEKARQKEKQLYLQRLHAARAEERRREREVSQQPEAQSTETQTETKRNMAPQRSKSPTFKKGRASRLRKPSSVPSFMRSVGHINEQVLREHNAHVFGKHVMEMEDGIPMTRQPNLTHNKESEDEGEEVHKEDADIADESQNNDVGTKNSQQQKQNVGKAVE